MNVEDTRLGVAEYVSKKHGLDTIGLKWGQGAKCIGGEIKVKTLERHSRLGFIGEEEFYSEVDRLRKLP